jgi:hypothetical protein
VKSIKIAKQWVDSQSKRKMGFKPFRAYMEINGRIQEIKVNSLNKASTEFNATTTAHGDRFAIKHYSNKIFNLNPKNMSIIKKIREQEAIKIKAHQEMYKLTEQLDVDSTLTTYFKEMGELPNL